MNRLSLALCGLVLAALPSTAALADTLNFDFSFTSTGLSGTGSLTATADGTNQYLIESISGTTDTGNGVERPISELLAPGSFPGTDLGDPNDNLLIYSPKKNTYSFDADGLSYELQNGAEVNLFEVGTNGGVLLQKAGGSDTEQGAIIDIAPVPEPGSLALLGTGVLGIAGVIRRRLIA